MKKMIIVTALFICFNISSSYAVSIEEVKEAEEGLSVTARESVEKINESFSFYDTAKNIYNGSFEADIPYVAGKIRDVLFSEIKINAKIMGAVILLGVISSFLSNLSTFSQGGAREVSFMCTYSVLAGISASGFYEISECAGMAIEDMGLFIKALIPVLTGLSAAEGRVISASVLHTEVLAVTAISSFVVENAVMPLTYAAFAVKFINNMTDEVSLGNLGRMADKLSKKLMSFMMLIFTGMLSLTSFAAGTVENMGMKTARFALNTFVPVTGGALSETVSSITASAGMIKNSAGISGIIAISLIAAYPVIKCAAVSFLYNFTGAVLEPVCDKRLSGAVTAVGECMGMILAAISVTAVQYIISASVLLTVYGR